MKNNIKFKEIESYPINSKYEFFGQEVTVTNHHKYEAPGTGEIDFYIPGVHIKWMSTIGTLQEKFVSGDELQHLVPLAKEVVA